MNQRRNNSPTNTTRRNFMKIHSERQLSSARGFTLIELMIVVAVVAIISAIALPSYRSQILKAKRTDAKTALLDLATREERYFSTRNTYTSVPADLGYSGPFSVPVPSANEFNYGISVTASTTSSFTATAVPNGNQVNDTCGTYSINDQGVQANTNGTTASAQCWR